MTDYAMIAENLTYHYQTREGARVAVDGISFRVAPGEILGFLGPNGAGKSTTVKMLTGQLQPQAGRAILLGQDVSRNPQAIKPHIGVCFETTNLYENMSATENLTLFARLFGVKDFTAKPLLERVGLAGREHERVAGYSKGMKQRLMVARALVNRPQILFLDEPTDGLDPVSSETIRSIILEESRRGAAVFLTTHDMLEADKLSDCVAFINQGQIVAMNSPHALKQQYGRRVLRADVARPNGSLEQREFPLDQPETGASLQALFAQDRVVTVHSAEATLEDIFIQVTGRGLL